jgi:hypothetical protein
MVVIAAGLCAVARTTVVEADAMASSAVPWARGTDDGVYKKRAEVGGQGWHSEFQCPARRGCVVTRQRLSGEVGPLVACAGDVSEECWRLFTSPTFLAGPLLCA